MLNDCVSARWSPMYQYLALTSLRDSHRLPTRHIREPGTGRWLFFSLPYFCFRTSISISAFSTCPLPSLWKTVQDLWQVFPLSSVSKSRLCLEFGCPCYSYFLPSLSPFYFLEWLQLMSLWLSWEFLLYSSFALSLNKEQLAFNLWAKLWECVTRPVYSSIYLRLWCWSWNMQPNPRIGPLLHRYIDATAVIIRIER